MQAGRRGLRGMELGNGLNLTPVRATQLHQLDGTLTENPEGATLFRAENPGFLINDTQRSQPQTGVADEWCSRLKANVWLVGDQWVLRKSRVR